MFFVKNTKTLINQHCLMICLCANELIVTLNLANKYYYFSESSSVNHNYDLYFYSSVPYFRDEIPFFIIVHQRGGVKISSRIKYPLRKLKPNISLTYTRGRYLQIVDKLMFKDDSKLLKIQSYLLLNDEF